MKTAIIYATSHGTTEKVCKTIAAKIDQSDLIDLKKTGPIDLSSYGQAIIGGSIHAGRIQKGCRVFVKTIGIDAANAYWAFICAMNEAEFEKETNLLFPNGLEIMLLAKR